ncbi:MAG: hypothetical protein ABJE95_13320 [Byssovorax sp.]
MTTTPYLMRMYHGTGVAVRASLNDLPFYRGDGQKNVTVTAPANHLLLPGENVLTLEVYKAPRPADALAIEGPVTFTLMVHEPATPVVHRIDWPSVWADMPIEERSLPLVHSSRFLADDRLPHPVYWDSPPARFDLRGTPEQHEAVREVYRAFQQGDADRFLEINRFKLEERQRFYPDTPELSTGFQRQDLRADLSREWHVRPLDQINLEELVFESRAGGRVAYVTRADGGSAIEAVAADDPRSTFATDLFLTLRDGRWRVFR